jgi:NAD-dependent deacetylase
VEPGNDALARAAQRIADSDRVVALTGAGISAGSGIATFRDVGGLWDRFDPDRIAAAGGWLAFLISQPWEGIEFLTGLRDAFGSASPNEGHRALAQLASDGHLRSVITQNVDGLHGDAGSERVIELHGSFRWLRCMACGVREELDAQRFLEEIEVMISKLGSYMVSHPAHLLRRCACGGLVRADVVDFGEDVHGLDDAIEEARSCDVMLVCGTSGVVYPAAGLPDVAREHGAVVVEVDPNPTELSASADIHLRGLACDVLPALRSAVAERRTTAAHR